MHRSILDQLITGRHRRIFKASIIIVVLAILILTYSRVTTKGIYEIIYFNPIQIVNISIQLFAIINPLSALPTFLAYTSELPLSERRKLVNTIVVVVVTLIFSFTLFGQLILSLLRITIESFKLAGGVLLMVLAIDMLGGTVRTKTIDTEQVAIVPLATPLLVGPGTMTTLIILTNTQSLINVLLGGLIAALLVYLVLRYSNNIAVIIGKNGILLGSRLMSVILAAVASNMIYEALKAWGIAK